MIPAPVRPSQGFRRSRRFAIHGFALVAAAVAAQGAMTGGTAAQGAGFIEVADRCSLYGTGFVDIGDGTCARVVRQYGEVGGQHVRVDLGRGSVGGTANAALRSDGLGMLPGAADAGHLRVPGGLYAR